VDDANAPIYERGVHEGVKEKAESRKLKAATERRKSESAGRRKVKLVLRMT